MPVTKFKEIWNTIQLFTCTKNIENRVKQCENLKKKLEDVNTCSFSTISVKICEKKIQNLKVVLALKI